MADAYYDSDREVAVTLPRTFAGIMTVDDGTVRMMADDSVPVFLTDGLNPVQRAVLVARLRAWADVLDPPEGPRG